MNVTDNWVDSLIKTSRQKVLLIINIWKDMGLNEMQLKDRRDTLTWHLFHLLNDMYDEEKSSKYALTNAIVNYEHKIFKLQKELNLNVVNDFDGLSLIDHEKALHELYESLNLKAKHLRNEFEKLYQTYNNLCFVLEESSNAFSFENCPTPDLFDELENNINRLETEKNVRINRFALLKTDVLEMMDTLGNYSDIDGIKIDLKILNTNKFNVQHIQLSFLNNLESTRSALKEKIVDIENAYHNNFEQICRFQKQLEVNLVDEIELSKGKLFDKYEKSCNAIKLLQPFREKNIDVLLSKCLEDLHKYWNICFIAENITDMFLQTNFKCDKMEKLKAFEAEIEKLMKYYNQFKNIIECFKEWELNFSKLLEIQRKMLDPGILTNRGGILLKIKRDYNALRLRILPGIENTIKEKFPELQPQFYVYNKPILAYIQSSWEKHNLIKATSIKTEQTPTSEKNSCHKFVHQTPTSSNLCRTQDVSSRSYKKKSIRPQSTIASRKFVQQADRLGSIASLLTPCNTRFHVKSNTDIKNQPQKPTPISISVRDLFLRPLDPVTPLRHKKPTTASNKPSNKLYTPKRKSLKRGTPKDVSFR